MTRHLKVRKITARLIRYLLTPEQKRERVKCAKELLKKYPEYDSRICNRGCKLVFFFESVRKIYNNILATKHVRRPSVVKLFISVNKIV